MIWIVSAGFLILFIFLLYSCVVAGARADRRMKDIMKNMNKH